MSSKTCRCCLKLWLCRVQVRLQRQKAGVRTSPDGLHRTSRTCRCRDRRTRASFHGTRTSRTTHNCLSWLSDAHGTKRILSDLYFAPLLHPKSQTPAGATSVDRIWMLDLLPWQQCVWFFLACFHGKLCFWPARCEDASAWEQSWPTTPRMQTTVRRLSTRVTWLQVADYHSALWVCDSLSIYLCFYVTLIYLKMHTNALDLISRCI